MITWMQRHKKWLVITIWISTIAFVGAGFVGWGSYDYGKSSGNVATVGNKEIQIKDLQNEYNTLYRKYQDAFGEAFNQEMAKQFKLEEAAYNSVVQKFTLLNYAEELGLYITNKEVAKYLVEIPSFIKDGKFDKNIYLSVLKQNRTNPTDFETQVKNDLLINKVQLILSTNVTNNETKNITQLYSVQDRVSVKVIQASDIKVDSSNKNIKEYWTNNKEKYKSSEKYEIAISKVLIGKDKKISKKDALKKYLKLKKDEIQFEETITIDQNSNPFISANLDKISKSTIGKISKPIEDQGTFIITKLIKKHQPKALAFDAVFTLVKADYIIDAKRLGLQKKVKDLTSKFRGTDIGFINSSTEKNIAGLSHRESRQLRDAILNSKTIIDSIILDNKAIVYKITDSKISDITTKKNEFESQLLNIKNNQILSSLIKQLQNRYEIVSNMKVK